MNDKQKLIDIIFQIGLTIHTEYDKCFKGKSIEEVAEWIRCQLTGCGYHTEPCGASWGILTNKGESLESKK